MARKRRKSATGKPAADAAADEAAAVDAAVERGLERYSQGDLAGALVAWRDVLARSPGHKRASSYVAYVEDHLEVLKERFAVAADAAEVRDGGVGLEQEAGAAADPDDYESLEVDVMADQVEPAPLPSGDEGWSLDDGWSLDAVAERFAVGRGRGPTVGTDTIDELDDETGETADPAGRRRPGIREDSLTDLSAVGGLTGSRGDDSAEESTAEYGVGANWEAALDGEPDDAETTGKAARPAGATAAGGASFDLSDAERAAAAPDDTSAEVRVTFRDKRPTTPSSAVKPSPLAVKPSPLAPPPDEAEEELTLDRRSSAWPAPAGRPPTEDPALPTRSVMVDEALLSFEDDTSEHAAVAAARDAIAIQSSRDLAESGDDDGDGDADDDDDGERETTDFYGQDLGVALGQAGDADQVSVEALGADLTGELDRAEPDDRSEDAVRRRIGWLIERARIEADKGHHPVAVVALGLAFEEQPDSAAAQKLIHKHRELLFEVYRNFLGNLASVPVVALPPSSIPLQKLDHRAAFLLSRIDGSMSFEDILDVSGMSRLEAYRHLCRLLLKGILEVR